MDFRDLELTGSEPPADARTTLETLERRTRNLHRVNQVSQQLTAILDESSLLGFLVEAAAEIIGAPVASVWLWEDEQRAALVCRATYPAETVAELGLYRIRPDQGVAGWVVTNGVSAVTDNAYTDARFAADIDRATGFLTQSMLAVPLRYRGGVIGVIEILNKQRADFDDEDLLMVETLAAATAIALENARLVAGLQAHNSELDSFAHTVAHDLKGPLSMILGYSDLLAEDAVHMPVEEVASLCATIARHAHKMDGIIREILLLSGVRKKQVTLAPIDMAMPVHEALGRVANLARELNATVEAPSAWPAVIGYAPWVEEVWANYLSNALKYGGRPPRVQLGYTPAEDCIWFWVRDNGRGLRPEDQAKLFVPFKRIDEDKATGGHGIGLSIVQRIVQRLGGEVAVQSAYGEGSTFKFSLPIVGRPISRYGR